ncbi:zinc-binding dehydrogenase [bacterium]|nr:zinc-binding dehydrogenase [bacterium]
MRASQYSAPGQVTLVDVPEPTLSPGQVAVRIQHVAICGSDLHTLYDSAPANYPFPPGVSGHECTGIVEESLCESAKPGTPVLLIPPHANALAESVVTDPRYLIPLPEGLAADRAVLAQQLGTVIFCCRRIESVLDKTVVVLGQGPAGLLFTALLYRMGAKKVIALDLVDHRLEVAQQLGAAHTVNLQREDPVETVHALTEGQMADLVVEAVGKEETFNLAPELARVNGELALFGIPKRPQMMMPMEAFLRRQLRTVTSVNTQGEPGYRSFRLALDMIAQKRIDTDALISHRLPFNEVVKGFSLAETKADGAVKVILNLDNAKG